MTFVLSVKERYPRVCLYTDPYDGELRSKPHAAFGDGRYHRVIASESALAHFPLSSSA